MRAAATMVLCGFMNALQPVDRLPHAAYIILQHGSEDFQRSGAANDRLRHFCRPQEMTCEGPLLAAFLTWNGHRPRADFYLNVWSGHA